MPFGDLSSLLDRSAQPSAEGRELAWCAPRLSIPCPPGMRRCRARRQTRASPLLRLPPPGGRTPVVDPPRPIRRGSLLNRTSRDISLQPLPHAAPDTWPGGRETTATAWNRAASGGSSSTIPGSGLAWFGWSTIGDMVPSKSRHNAAPLACGTTRAACAVSAIAVRSSVSVTTGAPPRRHGCHRTVGPRSRAQLRR
jgi:hypothetical protein